MGEGDNRPLLCRFPSLGQYPWLLYNFDYGTTFCAVSSRGPVKSERKRIPEFYGRAVRACCDGWLLLSDSVEDYIILNQTTLEFIDLPRDPKLTLSKLPVTERGCLLSSAPVDPKCLVLLSLYQEHIILYWHPGDEQWSEFNYGVSLGTLSHGYLRLCNFVCCGVKIYCTCREACCLISMNLDQFNNICGASFLNKKIEENYPLASFTDNFVVGSGDDLFLVELDCDNEYRDVLAVKVSTFNFSANVWERARSLNGRAFFIGDQYNLSCPVACDSSGMEEAVAVGSCIYFTLERREDGQLYSYRIEDESLALYLPCPGVPSPWIYVPNWLMPVQREAKSVDRHHITIDEADEEEEMQMLPKEQGEVEVEESNVAESMEVEVQSTFCDLPAEILTVVARNFSFVDYMNSRCVNRFFASNIRMNANRFSRPTLIFSKRNERAYEFVDSYLHCKHTLTIPEGVEDYTIRCAMYGWLLMVNEKSSVILFNPFTMELVGFPLPPPCQVESSFTFAPLPSSSDWLVIALFHTDTEVCIQYITSRDLHWKEWSLVEHRDAGTFNSSVLYRGSFYFLDNYGVLGILKFNGVYTSWITLNELMVPCEHFRHNYLPCVYFRRNYLVECDGDLLSIFEGRRISFMDDRGSQKVWIRIFKLINDGKDWQEIKTLGNYSLYLSRYSSVACIENRPDMANRIYFPMIFGDGMVYYSLNTKKFHSFGSQDARDNYYGARAYTDCAWIGPNWR